MGGIDSDGQGRTSMDRLYAVGETACNGVHGKNRLASNSLLESLVFARRAANDICDGYTVSNADTSLRPDPESYENYAEKYKKLVLDAIEKERKSHE